MIRDINKGQYRIGELSEFISNWYLWRILIETYSDTRLFLNIAGERGTQRWDIYGRLLTFSSSLLWNEGLYAKRFTRMLWFIFSRLQRLSYGRCRSSVRGASSRVTMVRLLWFPSVNYSLTALVTAFSSRQRSSSSFLRGSASKRVAAYIFAKSSYIFLLKKKDYIQKQKELPSRRESYN